MHDSSPFSQRSYFLNRLSDTVRRGDVCFDIGANIGFFAALMAAKAGPEGRAYAYEPVPETFKLLEINAKLAQQKACSIVPKNAAVSGSHGVLTIHRGQYSTYHEVAAVEPGDRAEDQIPCVSLADEFEENRVAQQASLVKIDVEGHELQVLQGALPLLRARAIRRMVVEVTPGPGAQSIAAIVREARGSVRCWLDGDWKDAPIEQLPLRSDVLVEF
jgi:FkbM family methyltransferase